MKKYSRRALLALLPSFALTACSGRGASETEKVARRGNRGFSPPLYPNETPELRALINKWADHYQIPRELVHRQAVRESTHRPWARNGPYWGLLQILPQTARTMGHRGPAKELLNPDVNLKYAGKYLRGAYIVSGGSIEGAMKWYAKGYYYEAKRRGVLVETGLRPG